MVSTDSTVISVENQAGGFVVHDEGQVVDWLADAEGLDLSGDPPFGLSPGQISPPSIEISFGGELVKLKAGSIESKAPHNRGVRRKTVEFTRKAKKNMMEQFASIDKRAIKHTPKFVTLTYPASWPDDPAKWKRHLDSFGKAFLRQYPEAFAFWKLEFQQRGAPHYHLLVMGVEWLSAKWLSETWFRIVDSGDPKHLKAGTEVRRCRSWRGAWAYVSKYMGKGSGPVPENYRGRFWGIIGRSNFEKAQDIVEFIIDMPEFYRLRRIVQKWLSKKRPDIDWRRRRFQGITAFLDWAIALKLVESLE